MCSDNSAYVNFQIVNSRLDILKDETCEILHYCVFSSSLFVDRYLYLLLLLFIESHDGRLMFFLFGGQLSLKLLRRRLGRLLGNHTQTLYFYTNQHTDDQHWCLHSFQSCLLFTCTHLSLSESPLQPALGFIQPCHLCSQLRTLFGQHLQLYHPVLHKHTVKNNIC